jgi:hypothetical protein
MHLQHCCSRWIIRPVSFQEFHENITVKADIIQATGDALAIFEEIQCLTPRYDIGCSDYGSMAQV